MHVEQKSSNLLNMFKKKQGKGKVKARLYCTVVSVQKNFKQHVQGHIRETNSMRHVHNFFISPSGTTSMQ